MSDSNIIQFPQIKTQPITLDFFMSQLRLALVAVLAYGGGAHWFTPEAAGLYLTLFTTLGPIIIPWGWSIASNFGTVRISSSSAAAVVAKVESVDKQSAAAGATNALIANSGNPMAPTVATVRSATAAVLALFALLIVGLAVPAHAAQRSTKPPLAAATAPATPVNPFQTFLDQINKKAAAINSFTLADAQAAMTMAANDPVGLACYTAIANKIQTTTPGSSILPSKLGMLQLIETARLAKLQVAGVQNGTDPVVAGCAGLILDANTTLLMLAGQGAIGAATTAIGLPTIPGL